MVFPAFLLISIVAAQAASLPRPALALLKQWIPHHWPLTVLFQHIIESLDCDGLQRCVPFQGQHAQRLQALWINSRQNRSERLAHPVCGPPRPFWHPITPPAL